MKKKVYASMNERIVVFRDVVSTGPGYDAALGFSLTSARWQVRPLSFHWLSEVRAAPPGEWYGAVRIAAHTHGAGVSTPRASTLRHALRDARPRQRVRGLSAWQARDQATLHADLTVHVRSSADVTERSALVPWLHAAGQELAAALTLAELLESKDVMVQFLIADVGPKARAIGIDIERIRLDVAAVGYGSRKSIASS